MTTKEISARIVSKSSLTKAQTQALMEATVSVLRQAVETQQTVQWQGLGSFMLKERDERTVLLPLTGEKRVIPAKQVLAFRATNTLKEEIQ